MGQRQNLQTLLEQILGSSNVYFQPPASLRMKYPCIVYSRDRIDTRFANNTAYANRVAYQITYIDTNPDNSVSEKLIKLPYCEHNRFFTADNLNHDVFTLYF